MSPAMRAEAVELQGLKVPRGTIVEGYGEVVDPSFIINAIHGKLAICRIHPELGGYLRCLKTQMTALAERAKSEKWREWSI